MAVPAHIIAAIQAKTPARLTIGRQEELPLSNVDERGRSYLPPRVDESKNYDPRIKQELNNKWATAIVDEEAEQMQGLTNLNARPWASPGHLEASVFVIPKATPPAAPRPAALRPVAPPTSAPPNPAPTASTKPPQNHVLDAGKCQVSLNDGQVVVPDANFCVAVSAQNDVAFFMLTAPGKPAVCLNVLNLEAPVIYGTSCIIKTRSANEEATDYTVKPIEPSTAEKLARVLENIQIALRKALKLTPALNPPPTPSTPQVVKTGAAKTPVSAITRAPPPKSLICADSPESSPETSPRFTKSQLVEVAARQPNGKTKVNLDDVIDQISAITRAAYCQITGCAVPMALGSSSNEKVSDAALVEWVNKGHLDSDAHEAKPILLNILRFLGELQIKRAAARKQPQMMSSQTMEVFKTIDRGIKNQGDSISYSSSEIIELKREAVVPAAMAAKKGLSSSLWAKK